MPENFDVIVVGGGCNGTGIARDCAMRGLKVLLLEKNDFASGTTGASSGMIHGGPRYLFSDVKTTEKSSRDAGYIKKIAPHLCFRIPFIYPIIKGERSTLSRKIYLNLTDAYFNAYDRFSALKGGKKHTRLTPEEVFQIEPDLTKDIVGAVTFDEWGINTHRLCVANALSAQEFNATIKNHTEVKKVIVEKNQVVGVVAWDLQTGEELSFHSKILFNATGPWAPQFAKMAGAHVKLRPAKGIHLILDGRITNYAVTSQCIDGRDIFVIPHENTTLLGTTDDDYYGDLDDIPVTEDEIEYLLQGMERAFPKIRKARVIGTTRGVRPTLYKEDVSEDALSRNHKIFDHEKEEGLKGLISMGGGKLASFREMSEEAADLICKKLNAPSPCRTHEVPLPGGDRLPTTRELEKYNLSDGVAKHLIHRYGSLVEEVLKPTVQRPEEKTILCSSKPICAAEVRYVIRNEWASTLGDIARRTGLASGTCQGVECLVPALNILWEEKKIDPVHELKRYCQESKKLHITPDDRFKSVYEGTFEIQYV